MPSVTKGTVEVFGFDQTIRCSEELVRLYLEGRKEGPRNVDFLDGDDGDRRLGPPSGRLYG